MKIGTANELSYEHRLPERARPRAQQAPAAQPCSYFPELISNWTSLHPETGALRGLGSTHSSASSSHVNNFLPSIRSLVLVVVLVFAFVLAGCSHRPYVVVYTSQDQEYAEPLLKDFTSQSGIEARVVYDNEAVKTVGLANRLLAERAHPQCDVFWNNEELRTRQLAAQDVFRETNGWESIGYRSRRIVINTNQVQSANAPRSLSDLTNAVWRGKVALAYPLFGTTATHFLALRQHWGDARWQAWCRALTANKPFLFDGNSVVVKFVGRGEAWIGLTDSDDIQGGQREGLPIAQLPLGEESLLIRNTVGVTRNTPHPNSAQSLYVWLQKTEVTARLIQAHALEGDSAAAVSTPTLKVDWSSLLRELAPATATLESIFLR